MLPLLGSRPELRVTLRYPHPAGDRALGVALWLWSPGLKGMVAPCKARSQTWREKS